MSTNTGYQTIDQLTPGPRNMVLSGLSSETLEAICYGTDVLTAGCQRLQNSGKHIFPFKQQTNRFSKISHHIFNSAVPVPEQ